MEREKTIWLDLSVKDMILGVNDQYTVCRKMKENVTICLNLKHRENKGGKNET